MSVIYRIKYQHEMHTLSYIHEISAHTSEKLTNDQIKHVFMRFLDCQATLKIIITKQIYTDCDVEAYTAVFINDNDSPVRIDMFDVGFVVHSDELTLDYFTSDWGSEFYPQKVKVQNEFSYGVNSGRSCKGFIPWAGVTTSTGCFTAALAWTGNWNCTITPNEKSFFFSMGSSCEGNFADIAPKSSFTGATMYVAKGATIEDSAFQMRKFFRKHLSLFRNQEVKEEPLEYNGWWPYEDKFISADVFLKNADIAKNIGLRYAVLDAGWFGSDIDEQNWYEKRGDWDSVSYVKFPLGIKHLFEQSENRGLLPGIWCEIEAVGKLAKLNETHNDLIAFRDGVSLGYICLGLEKSREWACSVIDRLLGEFGAQWIKFDFNLDPGLGCNSPDHNHGIGDGLRSHYKGYYELLRKVHEKYPDVILENCSSGGLRMDIEMLSHVHWTHLSDPDYTDFHLQCYWGALSYLHQSACLHFSWSQVLGDHNRGIKDPVCIQSESYRFDYMIRAVLMGVPGFSYRLPEFPQWALDRLKEHVLFYKSIYKDYILKGDAHRLTPQPIMGGRGERFPVFQFNNTEGDAILFAFRLEKSNEKQTVYPQRLSKNSWYSVTYEDKGTKSELLGCQLAQNGILFSDMPECSSEVVQIKLKI